MSSRRQPEKASTTANPKWGESSRCKDQSIILSSARSKTNRVYLVLYLASLSTVVLVFLCFFSSSPLLLLKLSSPAMDSCIKSGILPFYVYPLPPEFNSGLLSRCHSLNIYTDMCPYVFHRGLGQPLGIPSWFSTHQFLAEIIFHRRSLVHPCRVLHPSLARLFYVPFYSGLYASSVFRETNLTSRDSTAHHLASHLSSQPWFHPRSHFLVSGRTAWDFLRNDSAELDFGANSLFNLPPILNMSLLTVERQPWDRRLRQHGIPYPSYFHPSYPDQLHAWQERVLSAIRPHLFSFVGATRKGLEKAAVRDHIIQQCSQSGKCELLDCSGAGRVGLCFDPTRVIGVMEGSRFCLQPPGDSYTRRSTFDAFLAGCVPVFFSEHTAYTQYEWYLPPERESYSLFIHDMSEEVSRIEEVLAGIPETRVTEMREVIVRRILPRVTYMHPDRNGGGYDAVDVALQALSDYEIRQSGHHPSQ